LVILDGDEPPNFVATSLRRKGGKNFLYYHSNCAAHTYSLANRDT